MKAFDPNYKLLDEMYQDDYYPKVVIRSTRPCMPSASQTNEGSKIGRAHV